MFKAAHRDAKEAVSSQKQISNAEFNISPSVLPASYTFPQLQGEFINDEVPVNKEHILEKIIVLQGCLANPSRLSRNDGDDEAIGILTKLISKHILPDGSVIDESNTPTDQKPHHIADAVHTTQRLASHGLRAIKSLQTFTSSSSSANDPHFLMSLIAYSSRDSWSTDEISNLVAELMEEKSDQLHSSTFIIDHILQKFIRPSFSRSRPTTVTETGRKAMPSSEPSKHFDIAAEKRNKPWKYRDVYAVTVFEWAVENSMEDIITQNWNLFIPPLLTLIDDPSTLYRSRGLIILSTFLQKFPSKLLQQTGLGPVIEDAVHPTLTFLPSITPVEESIKLLPVAYKALEVLSESVFVESERGHAGRKKFFDRVMRDGVLTGYFHAAEHPAIVEIIVSQLSVFVLKMGIQSVKHLKDVIPMLSTILTDPFTTPTLLQITISALAILIQNTWPRIGEPLHRRRVILALVVCWCNMSDIPDDYRDGIVSRRQAFSSEEEVTPASLKEELIRVGSLFTRVVERDADVKSELDQLAEADPGLAKLLGR